MPNEFVPLVTPPAALETPALWFAFQGAQIAVIQAAEQPAMPCCQHLGEHGLEPRRSLYLGLYRGQHCYAAEIEAGATLPVGWRVLGLRDLFGRVEETLAVLSGRAYQLVDWDRDHQFCSRCGTPMQVRASERARYCPSCRFTSYPPVSPAIMALVTRGRELLLVRKPDWAPGRYSAVAGFVEPGETLEDAVKRETREEVGVEVDGIRYFGSQPWPFPHSLMVAFTAEYAAGEVRPDGEEIHEAQWFDAQKLPTLPASISISRRLITTIAARLAAGESANP
ncbi:MAG TPA: NAD(+) diphosphatase [Burkholderiales bacterium]|nr:NAD(+) diphosphatase [Burkholderiales bacterium]